MLEALHRLYYTTVGGVHKNSHTLFLLRGFAMRAVPRWWTEWRREALLRQFDHLPQEEQAEVQQRVDYYCRLSAPAALPADAPTLGEQRYHDCASAYFFDTYEWNRYFPRHLRWWLVPGDVNHLLPHPSITKSRPIAAPEVNCNSVLMKLNKVRHYIFFRDPFATAEKENRIIFRGAVHGKPLRATFFEKFFGHPMFDILDTSTNSVYAEHMQLHGETSLYDHLRFKYIMCLEGNDVASNLKWVMHSNSLAVCPRPTMETWFMEGTLIPNYHYIEVRPDFSDLLERIDYYNEHPAEAEAIVRHAHDYCHQFQSRRRERLVSLMVMEKYFRMTKQK